MRVLIISDTHGRHTAFDRAIMEAGKIDYLVHLGDTEGGEDYIEAFCGCPAYILVSMCHKCFFLAKINLHLPEIA